MVVAGFFDRVVVCVGLAEFGVFVEVGEGAAAAAVAAAVACAAAAAVFGRGVGRCVARAAGQGTDWYYVGGVVAVVVGVDAVTVVAVDWGDPLCPTMLVISFLIGASGATWNKGSGGLGSHREPRGPVKGKKGPRI